MMTVKQTQHLLAYLGYYTGTIDGQWGARSRRAAEAFQKDFGGLAADGIVGEETEQSLKYAVANGMPAKNPEQPEDDSWWDEIEFFVPEEFRCKCGGRYCGGYPHEIQPLLIKICDRARRWSGQPIQVISGLRCRTHNRNEKGVENSQHMYGEAADVYFYGKTPDAALAWLQSQPDVRYAYRIEGSSNIHFDIHPVGR